MEISRIMLFVFVLFIIIFFAIFQYNKEMFKYDDKIGELKYKVGKVFPVINELEIYVGDKSYTINKEKIFLCLKDKNDQYYDSNMLVYVLLHELSHVLNDEVGHGAKFQRIFDEVLEQATEAGIYDPDRPLIQNYCD
jgi:hypothetical protein